MTVCAMVVVEPGHAEALFRVLAMWLDGAASWREVTWSFQVSSSYVPFLDCLKLLDLV